MTTPPDIQYRALQIAVERFHEEYGGWQSSWIMNRSAEIAATLPQAVSTKCAPNGAPQAVQVTDALKDAAVFAVENLPQDAAREFMTKWQAALAGAMLRLA